ncbi:MAG: hypothetical protein R3B36_00690 [Polyangiaceae bacterium]
MASRMTLWTLAAGVATAWAATAGCTGDDPTPAFTAPDADAAPDGQATADAGADANASDGGTFDAGPPPARGDFTSAITFAMNILDPDPALVAFDARGNMFVAFTYAGTSTTVAGKTLPTAAAKDVALAKLDPAGAVLWATAFGGTEDELVSSIAVDEAGDVVIAGRFTSPTWTFGTTTLTRVGTFSDPFVAKVRGSDGVPLVAFDYSLAPAAGSQSGGSCTKVFARGARVAVACALRGPAEVPLGAGGVTAFPAPGVNNTRTVLALLDTTSMKAAWATSVSGTLNELPLDVHIAPQGHVLASLVVGSPLAEDPAKTIRITRKSNVSDTAIVRLSAVDGRAAWAQGFGATGTEVRVQALAATANGEVRFAGLLNGSVMMGTVPLASTGRDMLTGVVNGDDGAVLGAKIYGATGNTNPDELTTIALDAFGQPFVGGVFSAAFSLDGLNLPSPAFGTNLLFKTDATGTPLWAKAVTSSAAALDVVGPSLAVDPLTHGVAIGGSFVGTANFGDGTPVDSANAATARSGFVVRRTP